MNRADVELLDRQLDELGNAFTRNRAMQQAKDEATQNRAMRSREIDVQNRRADVDEKFREAQLEHYKQMEQQNANNNSKSVDTAALEAKQKLLQNVIHLNATGGLDEQGLAHVNEWLANDPQFGQTGIQIQKPPTTVKGKDAAIVNILKNIKDWRDQANDPETAPDQAEQFNHLADVGERVANKMGTAATAAGFDEEYKRDAFGQIQRKVRTPLPPPAGMAGAPSAPSPADDIPLAPSKPEERVKGQRYKSRANPNLIGTWTGEAWDTGTNAPPVAVPGFGAARGPQ